MEKKSSKTTSKKIYKKSSKKISKKNKSLHLCCESTKKDKKCIRKSDQKEFDIEKRRFSKKNLFNKTNKRIYNEIKMCSI